MSTGETWRLGHRPALDGLRGVAVLMVVFSHAFKGARWDGFGAAGVAVFFVLSGFLITSLLLEEHARAGRIDLPAFFARRARRLLPALVAVVAVVVAVGGASPRAAAAALLYVPNWFAAFGGDLGWLVHSWSLGIEEQFYLAWPLVVLAAIRFGRRALLAVAVLGSLATLTARFALLYGAGVSGWTLGLWTPTRADGLLIGCALAIVLHSGRSLIAWPRVASFGTAALLGLAAVSAWTDSLIPTLASWLGVVVILAVARGDYSGWLCARWLTLVGRRSYGLYLWHIPVLVFPTALLPPLVGIPLGLIAAWGMTLLSWRYIEEPFMRRRSVPVVTKPVRGPLVGEVHAVG